MPVAEAIERQLLHRLHHPAVGLVVVALPPLLLHHRPLIVEVGLADVQRPHAIRLQEERELKLVRGKRLEVVGAVLVGRPVHRAAVVLDQQHVLALAYVLRTLEHHVLEQVREPGAAGPLIPRANVVGHADGDHRRGVVRREDHPQAVWKTVVGEPDLRGFGGRFASLRPHAG